MGFAGVLIARCVFVRTNPAEVLPKTLLPEKNFGSEETSQLGFFYLPIRESGDRTRHLTANFSFFGVFCLWSSFCCKKEKVEHNA
jgi:hypothetical protein